MLPVKKILFPTDFSVQSEHAYRLACAVARDYGAELHLLHVAPPPVIYPPEMIVPADMPVTNARQLLTDLAAQAHGLTVHQHLTEGPASAEILRVADDLGCHLILMGTHGRTGLRRVLMGSIAEEVVRNAACPVVTIKWPSARTKTAPPEKVAEPAAVLPML